MNQIVIICNPANRENLQRILQGNNEIQIHDYASDGLEALKICSQKEINLILMVLTNDFEPINWIYVINARFPKVKILIMIETITNEALLSAFQNGASGYVLFTTNCERIISAIKLCLMGFFTTEQICMKTLLPLMNAGSVERNSENDQNRAD